MAKVHIKGETFNIVVEGDPAKPALIFSNSLSSDLSMWEPQMQEALKHFRIIRYDSRGHGGSVAPDRDYSIEELGRDAIAVLDSVGVEKAHWCGLSKGGMVGMWMLVNAPERLERVVLAHTAAKAHSREIWETRIATAREKGLAGLVDVTIERWFTEGFRKAAPETIERIRRMILSTPVPGYCGCCAAIRDMDQTETIRAAKNPVLVIIGAHDPATTPEAGKLIAERIPGARSVTIEAAHLGNVEAAADFNREMIGFLTATS